MNALIEPFFYCLLASMIWAPIIFLSAAKIAGSEKTSARARPAAGLVWPAALILAALPVIIAPLAAALGISLRAPAPLPPMADIAAPAAMTEPALNEAIIYAAPAGPSLADILRLAAIIYFYSFLMLFILAAVRHVWFAYRLNYAVPCDEPKLVDALEHWRKRIGVTRRPRYVFSHIVSSVCVYGYFRPVVVMPDTLLDRISIADAALMGAHEMAHVKRGDVVLFALCSAVKAVFWFNPFMHRICARATLAAEQGADALVLARGVDRRQYAHCFVQGLRLAAGAQGRFAGELIPSFTPFDKRSRRERLDAILTGSPEKPLIGFAGKLGLAASAAAAAGLAFAQAAFAVTPPEPRDALTVAPVEGKITSTFGEKRRLFGEDLPAHNGVDIKAARGEPVRAAGGGKVIDATDRYNDEDAWGKVVVIDHGHGLVTRYAHLDSYAVRKGARVDAGDVIGAVGATGKATGPHLHFEVIVDGDLIDPSPVLGAALPPASDAPKATQTRKVLLAPLGDYRLEIDGDDSRAAQRDENKASQLAEKMTRLEERMRERFGDFDAFGDLEDMTLRIGAIDLEGFEGAAELAGLLENRTVNVKDIAELSIALPDMAEAWAGAHLSEDDLEDIREARQDAMDRAAEAVERARERLADSREARREALQDMREARREHEAEMKALEREAARAFERASEEAEMLAEREAEIRDAKADLDRELAEIERRRKQIAHAAQQDGKP